MKIRVDTKPVSVNQAYPSSKSGRRYLSLEGKTYKNLIGWMAKMEGGEVITTPCKMVYTFGFTDKRRRDVDDYVKLTQDALSGVWFEDDCQITEFTAKKVQSDEYFVEIEMIV